MTPDLRDHFTRIVLGTPVDSPGSDTVGLGKLDDDLQEVFDKPGTAQDLEQGRETGRRHFF
jgi:hypothetical protein